MSPLLCLAHAAIVERIRDLEAAGVQDMVLATCDYDLEQLERFAADVVGRFPRER